MASRMFSHASATSDPAEAQPGSSAHHPANSPDLASCSRTIRHFMRPGYSRNGLILITPAITDRRAHGSYVLTAIAFARLQSGMVDRGEHDDRTPVRDDVRDRENSSDQELSRESQPKRVKPGRVNELEKLDGEGEYARADGNLGRAPLWKDRDKDRINHRRPKKRASVFGDE